MTNQWSPMRIVIVALLATWGLFFAVGLAAYGAHLMPQVGFYGLLADDAVHISDVEPNTSAAKAKIEVGDILDERSTPFEQRRAAGWGAEPFPAVGDKETVRIIHNGRSRPVALVAVEGMSFWDPVDRLNMISQGLVGAMFVVLGALLVLLRPSKMTWAFFIYCVGINPSTLQPISWLHGVSHAMWYALTMGTDVLRAAGYAAFPFFAALFPLNRPVGKLQRAVEIGSVIFFALFVADLLYIDVAMLRLHPTARTLDVVNSLLVNLVYLIAVAAFVATYMSADTTVRQRTRWVIAGLAVGLGVRALIKIPELFNPDISAWIWFLTIVLSLAVPLSVIYSVIRYRVFDIAFVISRALAITLISAALLAVFAVIDSIFHLRMAASNLGLSVEACVAVGISLTLHGLQHRLTAYSDSILFRRRHNATGRLLEIAGRLPRARDADEIDRLLLEETCAALALHSGALFRRNDDGSFQRTSVYGDTHDLPDRVTAGDPLTNRIHPDGQTAAMTLQEQRGRVQALSEPHGPALVVPIMLHHDCHTLVLYGHQESGADFDPDQIRNISALAVAASAAFADLESDAMRRRLSDQDALRSENERLRLENEALKRAKAAGPGK